MTKTWRQRNLFPKDSNKYGGELLKTQKGRAHGRPISTQHPMHLVLKSSLAKGEWSFLRAKNKAILAELLDKFSTRFAVKVVDWANVGNHVHLHLRLSRRRHYHKFIRALTGALVIRITGTSRWKNQLQGRKFWDLRPFSNVLPGRRGFMNLARYLYINKLEGWGFSRRNCEHIAKNSFNSS